MAPSLRAAWRLRRGRGFATSALSVKVASGDRSEREEPDVMSAAPSHDDVIVVDEPRPRVRRITMNRPDKRNSLIHPLRGAILETLRAHDQDPDVSVTIIRGAGPSFSAGYDLGGGNEGLDMPYYTPGGEGAWPRHVTEGWMSIWDLAKPVIAQVHGYCLAGASELATGCDLVYMAEDAQMGYPAVRFGVPDMHFHPWFLGMRKAMEMMLTGDSISGIEAAELGWANAAYPADELEERVLEVASRIALVPSELLQLNKRVVHRQMDAMGLRAGIRAGTELCALGTHTKAMRQFVGAAHEKGLTNALQERDAPFHDYRTSAHD
jgi:enoyl-CoA hydratase